MVYIIRFFDKNKIRNEIVHIVYKPKDFDLTYRIKVIAFQEEEKEGYGKEEEMEEEEEDKEEVENNEEE